MKNDFKLLGEMYVNQVSKDRYSRIVSIINESKYSITQKQILIEYTANNINTVVHLYEADTSRRGFLGALGKAALGAGATAMGLGDSKAQAQEQSDPLSSWIKEIEAWSKVFSGDTEYSRDTQKFDTVIKKLQGMSDSDKENYNKSCSSASGKNVWGGDIHGQQQRQKYGDVVVTRNRFIQGPRMLGLGRIGAGVDQDALKFLSKVMKPRKPEDILKYSVEQQKSNNPNDNRALNAIAPKLDSPNTWASLGLDTF